MTLRQMLKATPLYSPYRRIKEALNHSRQVRQFSIFTPEDQIRKQFYSQFIKSGDTVFDIGANVGNRSKILLALGCRVIAVEPQSSCVDFLQEVLGKHKNFVLIKGAAGSEEGIAEIQISNAHTISSMAPDWIRAVRRSGRHSQYRWEKSELTEVMTLDSLIARFGCPAFVKIDVEGFEDEVIQGLSTPVTALSFEFHGEFLDKTRESVRRLASLGNFEFNLSFGETLSFHFEDWVSESELIGHLDVLDAKSQGDIYVRENSLQMSNDRDVVK